MYLRAVGGAAFMAALASTSNAWAVDCTNLAAAVPAENDAIPTVYIENGDTQEPMIKRLGKALMASTNKLRIIYRNRPTCNIRADLFNGAQMTFVQDGTTPRPVRYIPADPAFDPTTAPPTCDVPNPPAAGVPIALGIGATYLSSCQPQTPAQPASVIVMDGPNQAYGFVTNKASQQKAILAEEAYLAYGFTEGGGSADPWLVQDLRFKRGNTASTTLVMATAMNLLPTQMKAGPDSNTSQLIVDGIVGATSTPDASLGILGMDLYDQSRTKEIKVLAFRTFGQKYAYFPDSTDASFDKANVRDGHYVPWAPTPYIAPGTGTAFTDPNSQRVYELVMGTRVGDDVDGLINVVSSGLIPKCAMKVTRGDSGQDLTLYSDPAPCGCYFDKNVPQGATTCTVCTDGDNSPCGGGVCRHGFCEAR
jgi:hypothetical protein